MRLWHYKLIPYIPNSQLVAQWRELNAIFTTKPNHILINYVYNYPRRYIQEYSTLVMDEMEHRGYKITNKAFQHYLDYCITDSFLKTYDIGEDVHFKEHNDLYLKICYYNLCEKYLRGQKDFNDATFEKLQDFYVKNYNDGGEK